MEMARRLLAAGEKIRLLVMLDSYPHISYLPAWQCFRLRAQRMRFRLASAVLGRSPRRAAGATDRTTVSAFAPGMDSVRDCAFRALRMYRPTFYARKVKFVRAEILTDFPDVQLRFGRT